MIQNSTLQRLAEEWERAAQRATEQQATNNLLGDEIDDVAGLRIQSGARSGYWSSSCSCMGTCHGQPNC